MVTRINTSQLKSKIRQSQNKLNNSIRNYNNAVKKMQSEYNRSINKYNTEVRKYNRQLRANNVKINQELTKLKSISNSSNSYIKIVYKTNDYYKKVTDYYENKELTTLEENIVEKIENENNNNLFVANVLENNQLTTQTNCSLQDSKISDKLLSISPDLKNRWTGALYSLNPNNPDATRHFCTSTREIFTSIFDTATDEKVFSVFPDCDRTDRGNATRRAKINYFLNKKGLNVSEIGDFIDSDIDNILELYHVLSDGTHGIAGRYTIIQLETIKTRVEDGIGFLCDIVA